MPCPHAPTENHHLKKFTGPVVLGTGTKKATAVGGLVVALGTCQGLGG